MKFGNFESGEEKPEIMDVPKPPRREADSKRDLPILEYAENIIEMVKHHETSIIVGQTGSGKTTEIPLLLLDVLGGNAKIAVTQPRRVAATSVCRHVAKKRGSEVGDEIGYQIQHENMTYAGTRINFMTDGILLSVIQGDRTLRDYDAVMVDEAHERSLNIDFALGLLKIVQKERKMLGMPELKVIITSATIEKEKFARYFGKSKDAATPTMEIPGRLFPVDKIYANNESRDYEEEAANKVKNICDQDEGDILIFMPGEREIKQTIAKIKLLGVDADILPLYGRLPSEVQEKVFEKTAKRKIIVSTNIAETSVTIPGIRHVVDSGCVRQKEYNPESGIESLVTERHSKSGCIQRAGRAGRTGPGVYHALFTRDDFNERPEFTKPEIQRSSLDKVVLMMKNIGIDDPNSFDFIDSPSKESINKAISSLITLGAIDEKGSITDMGREMVKMPLEPQIARMVIEAQKFGCLKEICTIASMMGGRKLFFRPEEKRNEAREAQEKFRVGNSDFLTFLNVFNECEGLNLFDKRNEKNLKRWASRGFLNHARLVEAHRTRLELFRALKTSEYEAASNHDPVAIMKSIAAGLIGNLLKCEGRHSYSRVADKARGIYVFPGSAAMGAGDADLLVCGSIQETGKRYAHDIQAINSEWLKEIAPQMLTERPQDLSWDSETGRVIQTVNICLKDGYGAIMSEKRPFEGEQAATIMGRAIANGYVDLPIVNKNKETAGVINDLWKRSGGNLGGQALEQPIGNDYFAQFYAERLKGISGKKQLEEAIASGKIDLLLNQDIFVSEEKKQEITNNNPDNISVGGKDYAVDYEYAYYAKDKFTASIKVGMDEIIALDEIPDLPSGRKVKIKVFETGNSYEEFSGYDLPVLKQKVRNKFVDGIWSKWRYSGDMPKREKIDHFDIFGDLPRLPDPVVFGKDPLTGNDLLAYPAAAIGKYYDGGYQCEIKYFKSAEEASQQIENTYRIVAEAKAEREKQKEKELLFEPARKLLQELQAKMETIRQNYHDYGLDYDKNYEWQRILERAERNLGEETKKQLEILDELKSDIENAIQYKENREKSREMVDNAVADHYGKCPLCGDEMVDGVCNNYEHDLSRIDFVLNDDGEPIEPAVLSQIVDNNGKIIAQLKCNGVIGRRRARGEVYLLHGYELNENGWNGEPFESLRFEDFGKIMTAETADARQAEREAARQEARAERLRQNYAKEWEEAQERVASGEWRLGRFRKNSHPVTGEEQWELDLGEMKYVVNRWCKAPIDEDAEYFFSFNGVPTGGRKKQIQYVDIENPRPEYRPQGFEPPKAKGWRRENDADLTPESGDEQGEKQQNNTKNHEFEKGSLADDLSSMFSVRLKNKKKR